MKQFFEKIKFKLIGILSVTVIAWFGVLLSRLPKIFERVQYLVGWQAIGIFAMSILIGLALLAVLAFFAWLISDVFEDLFGEEN